MWNRNSRNSLNYAQLWIFLSKYEVSWSENKSFSPDKFVQCVQRISIVARPRSERDIKLVRTTTLELAILICLAFVLWWAYFLRPSSSLSRLRSIDLVRTSMTVRKNKNSYPVEPILNPIFPTKTNMDKTIASHILPRSCIKFHFHLPKFTGISE